jgi:hypothetical protein
VFAQVTPAGSVPKVSVPFPLTFTSDGWTVNEKLLPGKTVVGDGTAHKASAAGLLVGYGNAFETIGALPGFVTVKESAPGALTNPGGKKAVRDAVLPLTVPPPNASETPFAWMLALDAKPWPVTVACN